MIKADKNVVEMLGTKLELKKELTVIIRGLLRKEIITEDDLDTCCTIATMSDEEMIDVAKEAKKDIEKMLEGLTEILKMKSSDSESVDSSKKDNSDEVSDFFKSLFED